MNDRTSISIDKRNKLKLQGLKEKGDDYNDVITRLIGDKSRTGEYHYLIYNGLFKVSFILDYENKRGFFLDDQGNRSETLKANSNYDNKGVQTAYKYFIRCINDVTEAKYNLVNYAFSMKVGDVQNFEGFILERVY